MPILELVCIAVFLCGVYMLIAPRRKGRLPEGPKTVPYFGNALQFDKRRFLMEMAQLGQKFGDAYKVKLFSKELVILNSYDLMKEALTHQKYAATFSGRSPSFASEYLLKGDEVLMNYSSELEALRKLVFRGLKLYGSNMADVEELVEAEIHFFLSRIQMEAGKPVNPWNFISGYVISVISMLITGKHLKPGDMQLVLLDQISRDMATMLDPGVSVQMTRMPWLRFIPFGYGKIYQRIMRNKYLLRKSIDEDRAKPQTDTKKRKCFLDFIIEEQEKGNLTEDNVNGVMLDMFGAGTSTSRSTMYSLFLVLTARPDVQERIQEEIDHVVGVDRLPQASDKSDMPYTQAVLMETLRLYNVTPLTIERCTMEDVTIRDYMLPKNTAVTYNMWNIHNDETFWNHPQEFNPSRLLDDRGELLPPEDEKRQRIIAFGLGKRMCVGESVARLRIFLALVSVLQKFSLLPDPDQPLPSIDPRTFDASILVVAPAYHLIFQPRKE